MEEDPASIEERKRKRFIPELSKLPWFLQIPLFFVAIFIIGLPYIIMQRPNPFNQAVAEYDGLCEMKRNKDIDGISKLISHDWKGKKGQILQAVQGLKCVHRSKAYKLFIRVDAEKHYILLLKGHGNAIRVRFAMENDKMQWLPLSGEGKRP